MQEFACSQVEEQTCGGFKYIEVFVTVVLGGVHIDILLPIENVVHLSIWNAQNTKGTRAPE